MYDFIFQIVIIVATFAAVILYVSLMADDTTYKRVYVSRELAFDITAAQAAPASFFYNALYPFPLEFDYSFDDNKLDVSGAHYYYAVDSCFSAEHPKLLEKARHFYIENSDYVLSFRRTPFEATEFNKKKLKYPFVVTFDNNWKSKKFMIAPLEYNGEENKLAKGFFDLAKANGIAVSASTHDMQGYLYVRAGSENPGKIDVLIPLRTALTSRKLASIIVNNFLDANKTMDISVGFSKDELMNKANVSVALQVGADVNADVVNIMLESLKEYYEGTIC